MDKKLQESLKVFSAKTKIIEDNVLNAHNATKEKLDKIIEGSKTELQSKKDEFLRHGEEISNKAKGELDFVKKSVSQKIEHLKGEAKTKAESIQNEVAKEKNQLTVQSVERQYNNLTAHAQSCVEWASIAILEAQNSALEAIAAKQSLDSLKK